MAESLSGIAQAEQKLEDFAQEYTRITQERNDALRVLHELMSIDAIEDAEFDWD